jgi:hypothetical protein
MNWEEYKKHKKLRSVSSKMSYNIRLLLLENYISRLVSLPSNIFLHWRSPKAHNLPPTLRCVKFQFSSEYHPFKGPKGTSGSKLGPLTNVCCEIKANFLSQLQEYSGRHWDVIFLKCTLYGILLLILYIIWHITADIVNFYFLYSNRFVKTVTWLSSHSIAASCSSIPGHLTAQSPKWRTN